jgi:tocopherol cyclase
MVSVGNGIGRSIQDYTQSFDNLYIILYILTIDIRKEMPMASIYSILNPAVYHGHHQKPPFFEGWYYRLLSADETARYAIIPGVILGKNGHAFVQVLDGAHARTAYHTFPLEAFRASKKDFAVSIADSSFNLDGMYLNLDTPSGRTSGEVHIEGVCPWPVTLAAPGIMGWYAWVPGMECYHAVLSFDHVLSGRLTIDGKEVDFTGGRGYIEKDWGAAFPEGYVWMQSNHFEQMGTCLTASIAIIPWHKSPFPGFIAGLWVNGTLHRFATYTGARLEKLSISDKQVDWVMRDRMQRLEITARRAEAGLLKGPSTLDMGKRIDETMNAGVEVRLSRISGEVIFEGNGRHAGLEVFQPEHLLRMVTQRPG